MTDKTTQRGEETRGALTGRRVLITGGSSGIGRSIINALVQAGADVAVLSRRAPETWEGGAPLRWTRASSWITADLRDVSGMLTSVQDWLQRIDGEIDVVIHSAVTYGAWPRHPLLDMTLEEWEEIFAVNVRAQFALTQAVLPALLRRPAGLLVGISSEVVFNAGPGRIGYAASKAASYSMLSSLAEELRDSAVRVVQLLPETMVTTSGVRRRRPANFDFAGYASPDSFAGPVMTLVERMGAGMHGQCFIVTAGGDLVSLGARALPSQTRHSLAKVSVRAGGQEQLSIENFQNEC